MDDPIRDLRDRQQITAVLHRYASALDDRDWDRLRTCFAPDASARYDPTVPVLEGYEAIEALCRAMLEPLDGSHHVVTNHEIEIDGDEARSRCYIRAQHVRHGCEGGRLFEVAGDYRDRLTRSEDGWRIRDRALVVVWRSGNPRVLLSD